MYIILLLGMAFLFIGIRNKRKKKQLLSDGAIVEGTIIRLDENEMNNRTYFYPVVEVKDHKGNFHEIRLRFGSTWPREIGSPLKIVFDPNNPLDAFEAKKSAFSAETGFIIAGSIITFIGIIIVILGQLWDKLL